MSAITILSWCEWGESNWLVYVKVPTLWPTSHTECKLEFTSYFCPDVATLFQSQGVQWSTIDAMRVSPHCELCTSQALKTLLTHRERVTIVTPCMHAETLTHALQAFVESTMSRPSRILHIVMPAVHRGPPTTREKRAEIELTPFRVTHEDVLGSWTRLQAA